MIMASRRGALRRVFGAALLACAASWVVPASAQTKDITIGVSIPTLDNPFWVRAVNFAQYVAQQLGAKLVIVGAQNREDKQISDVQSLVSRGVQALVVTPQSTASAPGLIRIANRAHLPIMIVDRYPGFAADNAQAPYLGFIGPDDVYAGRSIANHLIAAGAKKIVAIGGLPGSSVAEGRKSGLEEAIKAHPDVTLVQYVGPGESEDSGYKAMQDLLAAHGKGQIDGVWCYNDALCLGAFRAVRQAGRQDEIKLAGMDLVPQAVDLISKNTNYIFSTGGHWLQLGFAVLIAFDKVNGHDPLNTNIRLSLLDVDSGSFAKFKQQFIDSQPPYNVKDYSLTFNPKATSQTFPLKIKE
ncbi:substrate-binding domain-containing protein [Paraburkholderia sp. B3]|uniref:substrate-binding domain-containing protein n=1 Tax=Paraburkholderia sp. B3 TaxID=3134791 RepID=UPI003981E191